MICSNVQRKKRIVIGRLQLLPNTFPIEQYRFVYTPMFASCFSLHVPTAEQLIVVLTIFVYTLADDVVNPGKRDWASIRICEVLQPVYHRTKNFSLSPSSEKHGLLFKLDCLNLLETKLQTWWCCLKVRMLCSSVNFVNIERFRRSAENNPHRCRTVELLTFAVCVIL